MKLIINFIKAFLSRSGSYVFNFTVIARLLSFASSLVVLKFVPEKELGVVLYAFNIMAFLTPIGGLGLHQSLIRYGALAKTAEEKDKMFNYVLRKGIVASFGIIVLIIGVSYFIPFEIPNTYQYLSILSFTVLSSFLLEVIRAKFRIFHYNKGFAYTELVYSITLFVSASILSYFFSDMGYAIAILITPFVTFLVFIKKLNISFASFQGVVKYNLGFWKYGFFASLSNVLTQLLFIIDLILIGFILADSEMVTQYKYVSIIPFSLLFIPRVFINTDFVSFTEKIYDANHIKNYVKSYLLFFTLLSICMVVFCYFLGEYILEFINPNYVQFYDSFMILMIGIGGIFSLRGLFGNLLSSIGKAQINYYIASVALILNFVLNFKLIPELGLKGAAITSSILMWLTGILSVILFFYHYKKLLLKPANGNG